MPQGRAAGATSEEYNASWSAAIKGGNLAYPLIYDESKKRYIRVFKVLPMYIENAIGERTAGLVYVRSPFCVRGEYEVPLEEAARIAKK